VFERDEDFISFYANNIQFEMSAWDLKMVFGQLNQARQPMSVEQHSSLTLAWAHAKVTAYFMVVNVIAQQAQSGPIQVPPSVMPLRPNPDDPTLDEATKRTVTYLAWVHDQFFGPTPYVPPGLEVPQVG
jgi:hypothetical protein